MPKTEFAQLAHTYIPSKTSPLGWFMSRKLNGWGCMWDGGVSRGKVAKAVPWYYEGGDYRLKEAVIATGLWTIGRADKNGIRPKVINAPDWYLDKLPIGIPLQGELWCNDNLALVKSVCGQGNSGKYDMRWGKIIFQVYNSKPYSLWKNIEILDPEIQSSPYWNNYAWDFRMKKIISQLKEQSSFYEVGDILDQAKIYRIEDLDRRVRDEIRLGSEGVMIINPNSYYEDFRSYNLLKIKPEFDTEATIIDHIHGDGRHYGRMGALKCRMTWDEKVLSVTGGSKSFMGKTVEFKIGGGFSDEEREWSHTDVAFAMGKNIHFTFLGVSNDGIPISCNYSKI